MANRPVLAAVCLFLTNCGGEDTGALSSGEGTCQLEATSRTELGVLRPGRPVVRLVSWTNRSQATCVVEDARWFDGEGRPLSDRSLLQVSRGDETPWPENGWVLDPGRSISTPLIFRIASPGIEEARAILEVTSNDPQRPVLRLQFTGSTAQDPRLEATPTQLDFGQVEVGCPSRALELSLRNRTDTPVRLIGIELDDPDSPFAIDERPEVPRRLEGRASITVAIRFEPSVTGPASDRLVVTTEGGPGLEVVLRGEAVLPDPLQIDRFEVPGQGTVDVLVVVDTHRLARRAAVLEQLEALVDELVASGLDFRIAVTTSDLEAHGGRFLPVGAPSTLKVVTADSEPSPGERLRSHLSGLPEGWGHDAPNQLLEASFAALTPPMVNAENDGFLGRHAHLVLLPVTDREDASPNSPSFYMNFFLSISGFKGPPFFSAAVVSGGPQGCGTGTERAEPAPRLHELTAGGYGAAFSICEPDWGRALLQGRVTIPAPARVGRFFLTNQPVVSTLAVKIDGEQSMPEIVMSDSRHVGLHKSVFVL